MIFLNDDYLMHVGVSVLDGAPGVGSGRYPLGSGENPNQRSADFLSRVRELEKQGLSEKDIAKYLNMSTTSLRVRKSLAKDEERGRLVAIAKKLRYEDKLSLPEIAKKMGYSNDSSVRSLLNENSESRMKQSRITADYLKEVCDSKGMILVGAGVERELGVSKEKLREALEILKTEGYEVYGGGIPQVTNPGQQTNVKVLCPPGTEHKDIYNYDQLHSVKDYEKILTEDGTKIRPAFEYPASMDSSRLMINYADTGGEKKDGLIELRRGVPDLSLGDARYSQVRILVDGTHYLKGMAVYADDLPDGIDIRFNTNKKEGVPALGEDKNNTVLKKISSDPNNPFGSLIKEHGGQSYYYDENGKEHLSLINKNRDEGDWAKWSKDLSSQFLSKQPMELINKQLSLTLADKKSEYDEITKLTNPVVKKAMLSTFANDCDSAAVHLQAATLPRLQYHALLPLTSIKDNEVYAPNYPDGTKVALIRYPHGGLFEIPILTVNNKIAEGKQVMGTSPRDAIGINKHNADILSGADFDGDAVMVIPTGRGVKIQNRPPLKDLEGFDAKIEYGPGSTNVPYKRMKNTQQEMGRVSNLITDMTLMGAPDHEVARAVKHSMVVIDAEKHNLDYKRSEIENDIPSLRKKYLGRINKEGNYTESAATLISRASAEVSVLKRKGSPRINDDGTLTWKNADNLTWVDKNGKVKTRMQKSTQMAETNDAYTLVSKAKTPQEIAYAEFANQMKSFANSARKEILATPNLKYSASANKAYKKEVDMLDRKLGLAEKNAPREQIAQAIANSEIKAMTKSNPDMKKEEIKKASQRALISARNRVGAARQPIEITDREWEAIQSGAISNNKLTKMLKYVNIDELRQRATPKATNTISDAKKAKIRAMKRSGYTNDQIAAAVGVSVSSVVKMSNND